jgi:hypothetical protein
MKNILNLSLIILVVALSYACSEKKTTGIKDKENTANKKNDTDDVNIDFKTIVMSKSYKDSTSGTEDSTYMTISYVEMIKGPNKDKINSYIQKELIQDSYYSEEKETKNFQDILDSFIEDFKQFKKEEPEYPQNWFYEMNAKVEYYSQNILCLDLSQGGYTGGAHGNSYTQYINLNLKNADPLILKDLLVKDFEPKLNELIDKKFRELKDLKPGDNLEDKGGLFENKIKHNQNFAVTNEGLLFYYNNYEIAPYSEGPTELLITYKELNKLIPEYNLFK